MLLTLSSVAPWSPQHPATAVCDNGVRVSYWPIPPGHPQVAARHHTPNWASNHDFVADMVETIANQLPPPVTRTRFVTPNPPTAKPPTTSPCGTCPYRRDVPSGVWDVEEYAKLVDYDADTSNQPAEIFLCHQQDGRVCSGWAGCHDMDHSLALRLAVVLEHLDESTHEAILDHESAVELFATGREAAEHGLRDIHDPGDKAKRAINKLTRQRSTAPQSTDR